MNLNKLKNPYNPLHPRLKNETSTGKRGTPRPYFIIHNS